MKYEEAKKIADKHSNPRPKFIADRVLKIWGHENGSRIIAVPSSGKLRGLTTDYIHYDPI